MGQTAPSRLAVLCGFTAIIDTPASRDSRRPLTRSTCRSGTKSSGRPHRALHKGTLNFRSCGHNTTTIAYSSARLLPCVGEPRRLEPGARMLRERRDRRGRATISSSCCCGRRCPKSSASVVFALDSLLLFSLGQADNWLRGFQTVWFLINTCVSQCSASSQAEAGGFRWPFGCLRRFVLKPIRSKRMARRRHFLGLEAPCRRNKLRSWSGFAIVANLYFYGYEFSRRIQRADAEHPAVTVVLYFLSVSRRGRPGGWGWRPPRGVWSRRLLVTWEWLLRARASSNSAKVWLRGSRSAPSSILSLRYLRPAGQASASSRHCRTICHAVVTALDCPRHRSDVLASRGLD